MVRAGSLHPASPITRAGTPATVECGGTAFRTTEPAATLEPSPTSILPRIFAPAPMQHAVADLRMAVAALLAGAAERHVLEDRDVVLDDRRATDDEAGGVIEEDAAADRRGRVDVGLEDLRRPALQVEREIVPALPPQPVGQAVRLDGVEALEVEDRLDIAVAGGVAVVDGRDVGAHGVADRRGRRRARPRRRSGSLRR